MNAQNLLNEILAILHGVKDDPQKLESILDFLNENIYEEPKEVLLEIPQKYEKMLNGIAQSIDMGLVCYLNLATDELEEIPKDFDVDEEDFELQHGDNEWISEPKYYKWENFIRIEPLESHESFKIMEAFAESVDNARFQEQLFLALNNRKPFANFKWKIDNSEYRQDWFDFKQKWLESHVRQEIYFHLENQNQ